MLKKEYKYVQPEGAKDGDADENGVTDAMFDFSWERDVEPQVRVWLYIYARVALLRSHMCM